MHVNNINNKLALLAMGFITMSCSETVTDNTSRVLADGESKSENVAISNRTNIGSDEDLAIFYISGMRGVERETINVTIYQEPSTEDSIIAEASANTWIEASPVLYSYKVKTDDGAWDCLSKVSWEYFGSGIDLDCRTKVVASPVKVEPSETPESAVAGELDGASEMLSISKPADWDESCGENNYKYNIDGKDAQATVLDSGNITTYKVGDNSIDQITISIPGYDPIRLDESHIIYQGMRASDLGYWIESELDGSDMQVYLSNGINKKNLFKYMNFEAAADSEQITFTDRQGCILGFKYPGESEVLPDVKFGIKDLGSSL